MTPKIGGQFSRITRAHKNHTTDSNAVF